MGTKPSVAKFEAEDSATLEGKNPDIEKLLEVTSERKMLLLNRVYQSGFTSTFFLGSILDTSYHLPDMLTSGDLNKKGRVGRWFTVFFWNVETMRELSSTLQHQQPTR